MEHLLHNHLAVFVQVVRCGGFSAAASTLNMPKSTVSRWIQQLERALGARLLERTTRSLRLTEEGRVVLAHGERSGEQLSELRAQLELGQKEPFGQLRVTAPADMATGVLGLMFVEFCQEFPNVDVVADFTDRRVDLLREGIDVAIRAGPLSDSRLIARRVYVGQRRFFASPSYLVEAGTPSELDELSHHAFVAHGAGPECRLSVVAGDEPVRAVKLRARLVGNSQVFVRRALLAGAGIGFVPELIVRQDVLAGALCRVLPHCTSPREVLHLVHPSGRLLPAKTRAFLEFARAYLGQWLSQPGEPQA